MNRTARIGIFLGITMVVILAGGLRTPAGAAFSAATTDSFCGCSCSTFRPGCGIGDCPAGAPQGTVCCTNPECVFCKSCTKTGVGGGGIVQVESRQVTVALSATSEKENANKSTGAIGLLRWVDPDFQGSPLTLESVTLTNYGPLSGVPNARIVTGFVRANDDGPYPFVLQVVAVDGPGDTLDLTVGDAVEGSTVSGFSYSARGALTTGDIVGTWELPHE